MGGWVDTFSFSLSFIHPPTHSNHNKTADVLQVCHLLPRLDVSTEVLVEDETEIAEGDLITVKVSVTRTNLDEDEKAGPVHAPYFPATRKEGWWIILAHAQKVIIAMERVENNARTFTHELKVQSLLPPTHPPTHLSTGRYLTNLPTHPPMLSHSKLFITSNHPPTLPLTFPL